MVFFFYSPLHCSTKTGGQSVWRHATVLPRTVLTGQGSEQRDDLITLLMLFNCLVSRLADEKNKTPLNSLKCIKNKQQNFNVLRFAIPWVAAFFFFSEYFFLSFYLMSLPVIHFLSYNDRLYRNHSQHLFELQTPPPSFTTITKEVVYCSLQKRAGKT